MSTPKPRTQFAIQSRILHWLMAVMLLAMLFIGVGMVASLGHYSLLVAIHRPLGIAILILALIRLVNRLCTNLPPFPPTMSRQERFLASSSEKLLYALMLDTATGRLGHVVCRPLSDSDVWAGPSPADSSGEPDALRVITAGAYRSRLFVVRDLSSPP
jgi:Prokaryotic cytochrome b561